MRATTREPSLPQTRLKVSSKARGEEHRHKRILVGNWQQEDCWARPLSCSPLSSRSLWPRHLSNRRLWHRPLSRPLLSTSSPWGRRLSLRQLRVPRRSARRHRRSETRGPMKVQHPWQRPWTFGRLQSACELSWRLCLRLAPKRDAPRKTFVPCKKSVCQPNQMQALLFLGSNSPTALHLGREWQGMVLEAFPS